MSYTDTLNKIKARKKPQDIFYTPDKIAKYIIEYFKPYGKILEPCKGNGSFLKYLPQNTDWCEIEEGKDFFNYNKKVDWIITNPPYSIFGEFMKHSFDISKNVVFLIPVDKPFYGKRIRMINDYGGIKKILFFGGQGHDMNFPFGFPLAAFLFSKDYKGVAISEMVITKDIMKNFS